MEENLTVWETFEYYGTLYNMNKELIKNKIGELDQFLQLPHMDNVIKNLR